MTAIVDCPVCQRKLRILDELLGEQVKCPTCGGTFVAPAEANVADPPQPLSQSRPAPVVTVSIPPLEIGSGQAIPPMPQLRPKLVKEEKGAPTRPRTPPPPITPQETARGLRPCPVCGERVGRGARVCRHCGEFLGGDDDHPWPYRDCEPHRAGMVLALGIISIVLVTTCVLSVIGLPAGIAAWMMGQRDLRLMRAGMMDPEGMKTTQSGRTCGIVGAVLNGFAVLYLGSIFVLRLMDARF
jgi:hypothetical protein